MKKLILIFLLISGNAFGWEVIYSSGVNLKPLENGQFHFVVPQPSGHINAVKRSQNGFQKNQTITVIYQIKTLSGSPKFKSLDTSSGLKPNFRVMIAHDEMSNRWWPGGAQCVFLQDALDKGTLTYSVKLDPKQWQDVWGKIDPSRFKQDVKGAKILEIVFGGGRSFSHGINAVNGKADFQLLSVKIQ